MRSRLRGLGAECAEFRTRDLVHFCYFLFGSKIYNIFLSSRSIPTMLDNSLKMSERDHEEKQNEKIQE